MVHPPASRLALFCDFDGTFSEKDVGSTLAQEYLSSRRKALQRRFEGGEIGAWEYALELFEGFEFAPDKLDAFLSTVALDVGAAALVSWCDSRSIPFRVVSDGFDYNLKRLQEIHGVGFAFVANHLSFVDGCWKIEPGGLNPACDCGTGNCKRAIIEAYRSDHPDAYCVHVGDGRVSDLCAAETADLVFAKGSLAQELGLRGIPHRVFGTLDDVRMALETSFGSEFPVIEALPSDKIRR